MSYNVSVSVDFVQYSLEVEAGVFSGLKEYEHARVLGDYIYNAWPQFEDLFEGMKWEVGEARLTPYNRCIALRHPETRKLFCNLFYSTGNVKSILVQHTGQGCDMIPDMNAYMDAVQFRIGRLDIAIDVETDEQPAEYYAAYKGKLSTAFQNSATGQTFYLGSRKSDKFMRIYRYTAPHERAHLLRFEIQYKGEFARAATWHTLQSDLWTFALAALSEYGLPTEHITGDANPTFIIARRQNGDTLRWLNASVKPAILKLVRAGELDARAWIEEVLNGEHGN